MATSEAPVQPQSAPIQKCSDIVSYYRPCRHFRSEDKKTFVTSLDFDDTGELAIVSRTDDTLQIYNCKEGKHAKELKSQKYGVHLARFTHHAGSILYASTKVDDGIRYLSTHDNSYIRYYKGHTDTVTCIAMSPSSDEFVSCGQDNTVRLWALNSPNAKGQLNLISPYFAAYDPSASVMAIASPPTQSILLYDVRMFDKAPFSSFDLADLEKRFNPPGKGRNWSKIEFSNDGKNLLVATAGQGHFVLDAFEGHLRHFCLRPKGGRSERRVPGETAPNRPVGQGDVTFSQDGQFLIGGSGNDGLAVWDVHSPTADDFLLRPSSELPVHPGIPPRVEVVACNPRHNLICTADRDMLIWLPDSEIMP
ncbi:WD repeat-containing protein-like protein [Trichodelitschia bisporula]|uniref:WD repeat-containing protein-like protein n=1 Tax=Trichodelitschia bisporula TaxID=703511 RepID=A0A6G1HLV9_9PEZI|nr:WD repeat-containing protein-like protein [Trichodelitschia bisporula]